MPMTNTPEVLTECTADLAFMLMLNAFRRGYEYDAIMRQGWRIHYGLGDDGSAPSTARPSASSATAASARPWPAAPAASA
jgi:lactate dehydrogenase-like 2-hydroxyacid dehydrogenase